MRRTARALNKPRLVFGIDQKILGVSLIFAVIAAANASKISGLVLFVVLCALGRLLGRKDPDIIRIFNLARKQRSFYDPLKHD